jgi:hypothetical protein
MTGRFVIMSDATGAPPSSTSGGQQAPPPSDTQAGYTSPEEQEKQQQLERRADDGMNQSIATQFRLQQQQQAQVNAVASGGGFVMDAARMRTIQPKWQALADKFEGLWKQAEAYRALRAPAADDGSSEQKRAADAHADAYQAGVKSQQDYAQSYSDALTKAITATEQQEQAAHDALKKHGAQL